MTDSETDRLQLANKGVQRASIITGSALLLMAVLAFYAMLFVVEGLVTPDDAAQTAASIVGAESQFRVAIVSLYVVVILDIVVAWGLYEAFRPAGRSLALLMGWLRLAYSAIFLAAIGHLAAVPDILTNPEYVAAWGTGQVYAQALLSINTFYHIWGAGLVLCGLHLLVLGVLVFRAAYAPGWLGILVAIAGFGYFIDDMLSMLFAGYTIEITLVTFIGEVVLLFWLLFVGRRIRLTERSLQAD